MHFTVVFIWIQFLFCAVAIKVLCATESVAVSKIVSDFSFLELCFYISWDISFWRLFFLIESGVLKLPFENHCYDEFGAFLVVLFKDVRFTKKYWAKAKRKRKSCFAFACIRFDQKSLAATIVKRSFTDNCKKPLESSYFRRIVFSRWAIWIQNGKC